MSPADILWKRPRRERGPRPQKAASFFFASIDRARPVGWSLADEAQLLELVSEAGFVSVTTTTISLQTTYPSAHAFVEIVLKGSSKVTREELAQIPADRKSAFVNEVAMRLRDYETINALTLPIRQ